MKYEYMVLVWGGFFNIENRKIHKKEEGYYYFNSSEERQAYIDELRSIESNLGVKYLMVHTEQGYHVRELVKLNRITLFEGKYIHTINELFPYYDYETAKYKLENTWYPGFNDYPMGEEFDYNRDDYEVVEEWISGSFTIKQ